MLYRATPQVDSLTLVAAWACTAGALVLLTSSRFRRYSILVGLAAGALFVIRLGPIYGPFQLLRWARVYRDVPELATTITGAVRVAVSVGAVSMLAGLLLAGSRRRRSASRSHGSARWGQGESLVDGEGLVIGRRIEDGELLRCNGEGHLITLAPTRSGKGVSAVIPNLLDYPGSVLVVDVKPENAAVTARRRRELWWATMMLSDRLRALADSLPDDGAFSHAEHAAEQ